MKNILRRNISILLIFFVILFVVLIGYLGYVTVTYGERWFVTPYNPRISNMQTNIEPGDILDRAGRALLYTSGEERKYIADDGRRRATAHIIGDSHGMTYGAQTYFAKYLYGFDSGTIDRIEDLITGSERKGKDVVLTIDAGLSETALDALGEYDGAVVVMNYKTGEILASVSKPVFDPTDMSLFLEGGGESELVNRAFVGQYPPGSIFKLITAAAIIDEGMMDFTVDCEGGIEIGGQEITCWSEHGKIGLSGAIEHSCNVYFAEAARVLGTRKINSKAEDFLFNKELLFEDVMMGTSIYETTKNDIDLSWSSIGQYHDLMTPLHACMMAAGIANDGMMMEPKLLLDVVDGDKSTYNMTPEASPQVMDDTELLKEMMIQCVKSGTGTKAAVKGYTVGGKTGTAEVSTEDGNVAHSWFVGFVDDDKHPIAIAVIMERAGSGSGHAAPAAGKILKEALDIGY